MRDLESIMLGKDVLYFLTDHGLQAVNVDDFMRKQYMAMDQFKPNSSHHANVTIVKDLNSGLLFVKKIFGSGERKLPYGVAQELVVDYITHQSRLKSVGVKIALSYEISLRQVEDFGLITLYQLFFPEGTLLDIMCSPGVTKETFDKTVRATIRDTIIPVLRYHDKRINNSDSFVFSDSAPKNISPLYVIDSYHAFYFDLFVPRIRHQNGNVKEYAGFNPHIRSEDEMQKRFFTKAGIIQNFFIKASRELADREDAKRIFFEIAENELRPYIQKYFPNMSLDDIIRLKLI